MKTKKTNKELLVKGIKKMLLSALFMFVGPSFFYVALSNKEKPLFIPILILSIIICVSAVFFGFLGIKTIISSMFNKHN